MKLQDILSQEEIEEYHRTWDLFSDKHKFETEYNVHSGLPIIGKVFQFRDKHLFRAHIFKRRLRKAFDPYFTSKEGYLHKYFHTVHYFLPIEQIFHAAMPRLIENYNHFIIADILDNKRPSQMKGRIDFNRDHPSSIELIPEVKQGKGKFIGRVTATYYDDRNNKALQTWYLRGIGELRRYVKNIERLKQGDKKAVDELIREIEGNAVKHNTLIKPRNFPSKDYLIEQLKKGNMPEEELHDFFSYWDKEPKK